MKYVIEILVDVRQWQAKVALGTLPCQSTSLKLVDHSPTSNTSKQRVSSHILMGALTHFRADVYARQLRRMDASGLMQLTRLSRRVLRLYFGWLSSGLHQGCQ